MIMNLDDLKVPFPVDRIRWRIGATSKDKTSCMPLAYVDARDVMKRLDDVCGLDWQCKYSHVTPQGVVCDIGLRFPVIDDGDAIGAEWIWRSNGAGETQIEAEKGALSDAFKRAAVMWGVGRYLYYLPNKWVDLKNGKFTPPQLPDWATPEGFEARRFNPGEKDKIYTQVKECLLAGDGDGIKEIFSEYSGEEEMKVWTIFSSTERAAIKSYLGEGNE